MELLFDDDWIDRKAGVRRVLGDVRKEPEPVLRPERPWESARVHGCNALFHDREEGCFKLWYRAQADELVVRESDPDAPTSERDLTTRRTFLCYAVSDDGLTWRRPHLGMTPYGDATDTNIIRESGHGDSFAWNVLKDPDEPDQPMVVWHLMPEDVEGNGDSI